MSDIIRKYEAETLKKNLQPVRPGDKVRVHIKIVEGEKERIQVFEGLIIGRQGSGARETMTVRKISYGVGVERIVPIHSPRIEKIEFVSRGHVRRAKLYYLRELRGKAARLREKRFSMALTAEPETKAETPAE